MKSLFNPKDHFLALRELVALLTRHRQLTWEMTKRDITERYAGQILGVFWTFGHPLILMGVFVFLFAVVLRVKVGGTREIPLDYTTYLLSGLIPWLSFQESMNKSALVIVGNANLVKQVVFPIEILPVKGVIASTFTQAISTVVLVVYVLFRQRALPWTYALLPVLMCVQVLAMTGIAYIWSSIGTYFRDLKDFTIVFCFVSMYLMPIFFLPHMVPSVFRPIIYANPFSYMIWCYQDICYFGRFEHPWAWGIFTVGSITVFYGGYRIFRKLKIIFGNVL